MDGVSGVAKRVPSGSARLGPPGGVDGPGPDNDPAWPRQPGPQLPRLPAVWVLGTRDRGRLPGLVPYAHLDPGDGRCPGPGHAADRNVAGLKVFPGPRLGDHRPDRLQRDRLPADVVTIDLEMTAERLAGQLDPGQPLDRRDPVPSGYDQPQRVTVNLGEPLAVHRVRQQGPHCREAAQRQGTLEVHLPVAPRDLPAIGAPEHYFPGTWLRRGRLQHVGERYPGPRRRAHRA